MNPFLLQPRPISDADIWFSSLSGEQATATWHDITINGNNGTANNAGVCLANYFFRGGGAGSDDMVSTAYAGNIIKATEPWSLDGWVFRDPTDVGQVTLWGARRTGPNGGWVHRENAIGASGPLDMDMYQPAYFSLQDVVPDILLQGWSHIAMTVTPGDGAPATIKHYYNGALSNSTTLHTNFSDGDIFEIAGSTYNRWTGFIDTVRVYKKILSPDEILKNYYAGLAAHTPFVTQENLVSQYLPSGMTTTAWTDATGSNSMTGAVTAPPAFDGNDYYTIGNPANLQFTNNWSVEAWASQNDAAPAGSFERLISRDDTGGNRCFILSQKDNTGVAFAGIFVGGVLKSCQTTTDFADNNWHHYMVTHDGVTLKLYVDGALEASVATGGPMDNDVVDWEIGRAQNNSANLEGRVNTVRFYNATLSAEQVVNNYQAGKPVHS